MPTLQPPPPFTARIRTTLFGAFFTAILASGTPSSAQSSGDIAHEELKKGWELKKEGRCPEAIPHLLEAVRLDPGLTGMANLAQCEEEGGKLVAAHKHWGSVLHWATVVKDAKRAADAQRRLEALHARIPRLVIHLGTSVPTSTVVLIDDNAIPSGQLTSPVLVDPGKHLIMVRAPGHQDRARSIALTEGEQEDILIRPGDIRMAGDSAESPDSATAPPAEEVAPSPASRPRAGGSELLRVSFEGVEADVTLGIYSCSAPCELKVPQGTYELTVDGRPARSLNVGPDLVTIVQLKHGSPGLLIAGVTVIAVGAVFVVAGLSTSNNCTTPSSGSGESYCLSIPLTLEATGVLWGVAGLALTIVGGIVKGRTRVDVDPTEVSKRVHVMPWAAAADNLRGGLAGGVGGLAVVF
ncbi:MAG: hypothetical protein ACLQVI_20230 [Polyangiaceae bacterium]